MDSFEFWSVLFINILFSYQPVMKRTSQLHVQSPNASSGSVKSSAKMVAATSRSAMARRNPLVLQAPQQLHVTPKRRPTTAAEELPGPPANASVAANRLALLLPSRRRNRMMVLVLAMTTAPLVLVKRSDLTLRNLRTGLISLSSEK
jgi:hypothetical protein